MCLGIKGSVRRTGWVHMDRCFLVICTPHAVLCYLLQARSAIKILCFCTSERWFARNGPHVPDQSRSTILYILVWLIVTKLFQWLALNMKTQKMHWTITTCNGRVISKNMITFNKPCPCWTYHINLFVRYLTLWYSSREPPRFVLDF